MAVRAVVVILCAAAVPSYARQDGLARTPPMGWSSWYAYGADFNETSVLEAADALVRTGLRDAGYEYVNLDDGWMAPMRDRFGNVAGLSQMAGEHDLSLSSCPVIPWRYDG